MSGSGSDWDDNLPDLDYTLLRRDPVLTPPSESSPSPTKRKNAKTIKKTKGESNGWLNLLH